MAKIELDPAVLAELREYYTGQADAIARIGEYLREHTVLPDGGYGMLLSMVESVANPVMEFVSTGIVSGAELIRTRVEALTDYEQQQARLEEAQKEVISRMASELGKLGPSGPGFGGP